MKAAPVARIVIWSLVAIVLISILVTMAGNFGMMNFGIINIQSLFSKEVKDTHDFVEFQTGSVPVSSITRIKTDWVTGSVEIRLNETLTDTLVYTEYADKDQSKDKAAQISTDSGTFEIVQNKNNRSGFFSIFSSDSYFTSNLVIELPPKVFEAVTVNQVSGGTKISNLITGTLKLQSVSGGINLDTIECQSIDTETVSGGVKGTGITTKTITSEVVSGGIEYSGSFENVNTQSVSGGVNLTTDKPLISLEVETVSGSVTLTQPDGDGFRLKYNKKLTSVYSDFPIVTDSGEGKTGYYKDSEAPAFYKIEAVSGKLKIVKA